MEPIWLTRIALDVLHHDLIVEHGGRPGVRDQSLLESTIARLPNRWHYEGPAALADFAALYGHGLARAHPYVDGNKRIAFVAMAAFLDANGMRLEAADDDVVELMRGVAGGTVGEHELADWIRRHVLQVELSGQPR